MLQQRVCFVFKTSDQANDVRPVIGNNSYPVLDSGTLIMTILLEQWGLIPVDGDE